VKKRDKARKKIELKKIGQKKRIWLNRRRP
jgi:hypothetical protein